MKNQKKFVSKAGTATARKYYEKRSIFQPAEGHKEFIKNLKKDFPGIRMIYNDKRAGGYRTTIYGDKGTIQSLKKVISNNEKYRDITIINFNYPGFEIPGIRFYSK